MVVDDEHHLVWRWGSGVVGFLADDDAFHLFPAFCIGGSEKKTAYTGSLDC